MSTYRGWEYPADDLHRQDVADRYREVSPALIPPSPPFHLRRLQPAVALLPATSEWIASLPTPMQPRVLAAKFPRIANLLCLAWNDPPTASAHFSQLLVEARPRRAGFPPEVLHELKQLQSVCAARCARIGEIDGRDGRLPAEAPADVFGE